jgi:hypothetical protein
MLTQQQKADLQAVGFSAEQICELTPQEAEEIIAATSGVVANTREVREFIETIIAQARAATEHLKQPGLLQMMLIHPLDDNNVVLYRYKLDDVDLAERMTREAMSASAAGHNIYIEGRTVCPGLTGKKRGELADTVAVFAIVVDSDNDKGKGWTPTVPTSLAVETSPGNAHYWLFFEQALDPATGQALGERLRAITNADADTGNVCQPYRVAGTINYPNKKKQAQGRVVTPTHSLGFDPETLWTPERFEQEFPPSPDPKINGGGGQTNSMAAGTASAIDESSIPTDTLRVIHDGVEDDADRSDAFWNVMMVLKEDGWTLNGIFTLLDRYPKGIASKYRGRLQREVERTWNKLARPSQARRQQSPSSAITPPSQPGSSSPPPGAGPQPGTPPPGSGPQPGSSSPPPPPPPGAGPQPGSQTGPQQGAQPGAAPAYTIADVVAVFRKWLALPNPTPIYAMLGAIAANVLPGDPVWLGLLASPSSAKTELLLSAAGLPHVVQASTLTPAALLSGTPRQQQAVTAKGGLLREIGSFGILLFKDFTSVLSMRQDTKVETLAALREIFDGSWTRRFGSDGGKTAIWKGKMGLLFGVTGVIDSHYTAISEMGDRYLLCRMQQSKRQLELALKHSGSQNSQMRNELKAAVIKLFAARSPLQAPSALTVDSDEYEEFERIVSLVVRLRGSVERDRHSREIEAIPGAEGPARIALCLERLLAGLTALGLKRKTAFKVIKTIAMDSTPPLRRQAYEYLCAKKDMLGNHVEAKTPEIAKALRLPTNTVRRALEDLAAYYLVQRVKGAQGAADAWIATPPK